LSESDVGSVEDGEGETLMPRFCFDVRDGGKITLDKEGMIFEGIEGARDEALRALAELAKNVIEVRN
jgi:hypothetical protein